MSEENQESIIREGKVRLVLPDPKKYRRADGKIEPSWLPVFYNPYAKENRDLTVLGIKSYDILSGSKSRVFVEPLSGTCVRSLRVLVEAMDNNPEAEAYASDVNNLAIEYCEKNKKLNNIEDRLHIGLEDANIYMLNLDKNGVPVDIVDVDPFGSPIYYIQSAIRLLGKGGLLFVTATDLGTLSGKYDKVALRRYGVRLRKTLFSKEIAARTLISGIVRIASMLDRGVRPLYTYYHEHYLKLVMEVTHSKNEATETMSKLGYICMENQFFPTDSYKINSSWYSECREPIGPLWLGELWDMDYSEKIYDLAKKTEELSNSFVKKLEIIKKEAFVTMPFYYRIDKLCSLIRRDMPSFDKLLQILQESGYQAERTHFDNRAIRTNASYEELISLLREA